MKFWLANWAANRSAKPAAFESGIRLSSAFSDKIPTVKNETEGAVANLLGMFLIFWSELIDDIGVWSWNHAQFLSTGHKQRSWAKIFTTEMGFEPTRAKPIGLAVQRLNHSATQSLVKNVYLQNKIITQYLISPFGILWKLE